MAIGRTTLLGHVTRVEIAVKDSGLPVKEHVEKWFLANTEEASSGKEIASISTSGSASSYHKNRDSTPNHILEIGSVLLRDIERVADTGSYDTTKETDNASIIAALKRLYQTPAKSLQFDYSTARFGV